MTYTQSTKRFPIQTPQGKRLQGSVSEAVYMRAYEVYSKVYGSQEALITGGCRGGFSTGELIAFLYAYPFPKEEWRSRVDAAFSGMENL